MQKSHQIAFKVGREIVFILMSDIVLLKAENIYCNVHLANGQCLLVSSTLKELFEKLSNNSFFKPHRSYIINTNYVERYVKSDLWVYLKTIKEPIPISRNLKSEFEKVIL
ncbi:MAG: LytTR family DNA-binding domain-containing protein [Bacteroidia bacterium]|nr:LytTR family DNA-binding domain-containing protein [Bacteroidia bacterium]